MTPNHFTWMDPVRGDIYQILLTDTGDFHSADRFIELAGARPIHYATLKEVPQPHQGKIEQEIYRRAR